ncbi:hypothetical protein [Selenomonas ruminantium]|uniref:hypothetical protein n=1 Tax=Selenomonas ruminantium TaxID=971 RepID=UPI001C49C9E1|nr:hypothetical protein [Selenomonas ruminantium]
MLFHRRNDCLNEVKAGPQTAFAGSFVDWSAVGLPGAGSWKIRTSAGGSFSGAAKKYSHRRPTAL